MQCDVLVGNPPFLGSSFLRRELGDNYTDALFDNFGHRVPLGADLCCYWFEKARKLIQDKKCKRAGLLATQGIRGGANREVLKRIKETGDIFFGRSDRKWILDGAAVHISMVGFDDGTEQTKFLDGKPVGRINPNLTAQHDTTGAIALKQNAGLCLRASEKGGSFVLEDSEATPFLGGANPHGKPNSDVVRPWMNSELLLRGSSGKWIVDFFGVTVEAQAAKYESPFQFLRERVKAERQGNRDVRLSKFWWLHRRSAEDMRSATAGLNRFIVTPSVAKHRTFIWVAHPLLPDHQLYVFARSDDYFFGMLHSRFHEVWALAQGTQLREKESGFRYTPTTCFETFPFPFPDDLQPQKPAPVKPPPKLKKPPEPDRFYAENLAAKNYFMGKEEPPPYGSSSQREEAHPSPSALATPLSAPDHRAAVAAAAKELNDLRERWLNPPEWTVERILEFPGSADGPWSRFVVNPGQNGVGTVRYPRLEPRDADCAAKLKQRTLTNLYNERPAWLDFVHKALDVAVAAAYGWPADLTDEQILEKLLALNLERAAEEAKAAKVKKPRTSRLKHADELI